MEERNRSERANVTETRGFTCHARALMVAHLCCVLRCFLPHGISSKDRLLAVLVDFYPFFNHVTMGLDLASLVVFFIL